MRTVLVDKILNSGRDDVFLMAGDLGFSVVEPFAEKYPDRFLNAGIAEQNMTGMAAGLASEGYKVFTYSIGNFNTLRCLEQIRNDVCYHNLDVTIISTGGGFAYGTLGYSHHAIQDIAALGTLPHMTLLLPGDPIEAAFCAEYMMKDSGPKYFRLGRGKDDVLHQKGDMIGEVCAYGKTGAKYAILTVGAMLKEGIEAQKKLLAAGIEIDLLSCPIVGREFSKNIRKKASAYEKIFTLEDHIAPQGFGSRVSKAFEDTKTRVVTTGVDSSSCYECGCQDHMNKQNNLNADSVVKNIKKSLNN